MTNPIEILAPAGTMENLIAAVYAGANSVYLGVQSFNARASAANFSFEELKEAVSFCHARNVKVNVTLNTILYDTELAQFVETVKQVAQCGIDAVIVQDLAAGRIVKNVAPNIDLHGSTQMAVHNLEGALLLKKMGYTRVILARELSLEQVEYITKNCGIETEIFIHGALCMSLSGQCYASAFLGGRSGNRGRCAGTCRLPMSARGDLQDNHLSLKDLCAMDMLERLRDMGVACVKIEGRLRTPEYVALAVDSAKKALAGQEYDQQLLADTFSRSGFTNGFLENKLDKNVFGVRTKEDSQKTKETLPKIRELYRREGQYIPVSFQFDMKEQESVLSITDGIFSFSQIINQPVQDAKNNFEPALKGALEKLGGTPFFLQDAAFNLLEGKYIPLSAVNAARRELITQLLQKRAQVCPHPIKDYVLPQPSMHGLCTQTIARFESINQIPSAYADKFAYIIIPIDQWKNVPEVLQGKIVLELERDLFSGSERMEKLIEEAADAGFERFCVQNIGHLPLVSGYEIFSSFTLNISNSLAAKAYEELGIEVMTLSPEISLEQIKRISPRAKTAVIAYGHLPLMFTKACPLQNVKTCKDCDGTGFITDRKGMQLPVTCHRGIKGYREIFNPIPIYMGERQKEIYADFAVLNFTVETSERVKKVLELYFSGTPLDTDFTRGLYYKSSI